MTWEVVNCQVHMSSNQNVIWVKRAGTGTKLMLGTDDNRQRGRSLMTLLTTNYIIFHDINIISAMASR